MESLESCFLCLHENLVFKASSLSCVERTSAARERGLASLRTTCFVNMADSTEQKLLLVEKRCIALYYFVHQVNP